MKTYILPKISFSLEKQDDITNINVNQKLFTTINNKKSKIQNQRIGKMPRELLGEWQ